MQHDSHEGPLCERLWKDWRSTMETYDAAFWREFYSFVKEDQLLSQDNVVAITSPRFWNEALQHATNQATLLSEEAQLRVSTFEDVFCKAGGVMSVLESMQSHLKLWRNQESCFAQLRAAVPANTFIAAADFAETLTCDV